MNMNRALRLYTNNPGGTIVNPSKTSFTSYFLAFALGTAIVLSAGCLQEATAPVGAQDHGQQLAKAGGPAPTRSGDTSDCHTASDILQAHKELVLKSDLSQVTYPKSSVPQSTLVSFGICQLDTAGTLLLPKAVVLGPISNLVFLNPLEVKLDSVGAGLPSNTVDGAYFRVYRLNEVTGAWDSVGKSWIKNGFVKYQVSQNGTYGVRLDSTWKVRGVISPRGGTLRLLHSQITFPPGALRDSTLVDFDITSGIVPPGLNGATDRIFEFGPEGIVFNAPVTLQVAFEDAGIDPTGILRMGILDPYAYTFYYYDETKSVWVPQPTVVDRVNQMFVVTLSHFSRYAFGR